MIIIPDSSIVVSSLFGQEDAVHASSVLEAGHVLIAPDLLAVEVANAIWRLRRMGQIEEAEAESALSEFRLLPITLVRLADLYTAAYRIAVTCNHSLYDCTFLALAEQRNGMVVTADRRLLTKITNSRYGDYAASLTDFITRH